MGIGCLYPRTKSAGRGQKIAAPYFAHRGASGHVGLDRARDAALGARAREALESRKIRFARHGYGIAQMIRANSRNVLQVDAGSLYPALHRLERQGAVSAEWGMSDKNQRVRIYRLTARGRKQLTSERSRWELLSAAMAGVLSAQGEGNT
jgi:PadR family transcriptional regulator PadR